MKQLILCIAACMLFASCGKTNKNHVSTWYIDGKKYETKEGNGYQYRNLAYLMFTGEALKEDKIAPGLSFF